MLGRVIPVVGGRRAGIHTPHTGTVVCCAASSSSVQFGHRLLTRREIEIKLGYPAGPGPGGNLPVPSFAADDARENKGYVLVCDRGLGLRVSQHVVARLIEGVSAAGSSSEAS